MSLFTKKYVCRYGRYQGLSLEEAYAISDYMKENSHVIMGRLLKSNVTLSEGFRIFLADLVAGNITRSRDKPSKARRDLMIYDDMETLRENQPGIPLRGNAKESGACTVIGERYHLSEEAVLKAYQTWQQHIDDPLKHPDPFKNNGGERIHVEIIMERNPHPAMTITDTHYSADGTITKTVEHLPAYDGQQSISAWEAAITITTTVDLDSIHHYGRNIVVEE